MTTLEPGIPGAQLRLKPNLTDARAASALIIQAGRHFIGIVWQGDRLDARYAPHTSQHQKSGSLNPCNTQFLSPATPFLVFYNDSIDRISRLLEAIFLKFHHTIDVEI